MVLFLFWGLNHLLTPNSNQCCDLENEICKSSAGEHLDIACKYFPSRTQSKQRLIGVTRAWVLPVSCLHKYAYQRQATLAAAAARVLDAALSLSLSLTRRRRRPFVCSAPLFLLHGCAPPLARGASARLLRRHSPSRQCPASSWTEHTPRRLLALNPCALATFVLHSGKSLEWNGQYTELANTVDELFSSGLLLSTVKLFPVTGRRYLVGVSICVTLIG